MKRKMKREADVFGFEVDELNREHDLDEDPLVQGPMEKFFMAVTTEASEERMCAMNQSCSNING